MRPVSVLNKAMWIKNLLNWLMRRHDLPNIPQVQRALPLVIREALREEIQACWSASLETLVEYNEIGPGMAEQILCLAEQSVIQKIELDAKRTKATLESAKTTLRVTVGVIVLAFAAAVVSFALEYQVAGIAFVAISIAALIRSSVHV